MTEVQPYLSIIIPFYNRANLFHRPLQSIKPFRGMVTEVILVDNGSTDEAPLMANQFAESISGNEWMKVKILSCTKRNACAARNLGLAEATGKWIYFFDSDDEFSQEFMPDFHTFSQLHDADDLIALRTAVVMGDGSMRNRTCLYSTSPIDQILSSLLSTQSMVFKSDFIRKIGGWNEKVLRWDDWELGLRALLHAPQVHWMKDRTYHRLFQHAQSLTGRDESSAYERSLSALEEARLLLLRFASSPESFLGKNQSHKHRSCFSPTRMLHALAAREAILAGMLQAEQSADQSKDAMRRAYKTLAFTHTDTPYIYIWSNTWKLFLRLLYLYTKRGHRGAWRLALTLSAYA